MKRIAALIACALWLTACGGEPNVQPEGDSLSEKSAALDFGQAVVKRGADSEVTATCSSDGDGTYTCSAEWRSGIARGAVVGEQASIVSVRDYEKETEQ